MVDFLFFVLPLAPMVLAAVEDLTSREGEFWTGWILMSVLLAAFWKLLAYPETIVLSLAFTCLTGAIGLYLYHRNAWSDGDALFYGILGFILPIVDVTFFLVWGMLCLILAMFFDKLVMEPWSRKKFHWKKGSSHALWVVPLIYIVYWGVVVL